MKYTVLRLLRIFAALFLLFSVTNNIYCTVSFSGLDLNSQNTLLFAAQADNPWQPEYKALFSSSLDGKNVQILSCFPETMELLEEGRTLQIRNWFGTARFSSENSAFVWTSTSPLFERGEPLPYNPPSIMSVSPDGNWTAYLRKIDSIYAELVLTDEENNLSTVITDRAIYDSNSVPVRWAPDSSYIVYEKNGSLMFADPSMFFEKTRISEKYRTLAEGSIKNVCWASSNQLVYASGTDLFSVKKNELFTRAMYSAVVGTGQKIGQFPAAFDDKRDSFWIDNTGSAVLYIQNNKNLWMYELSSLSTGKNASVTPFVNLPDNILTLDVFWTSQNLPIIWVEQLCEGIKKTFTFKMERSVLKNGAVQYHVVSLPVAVDASKPVLSPDKSKIAFNTEKGLQIYDAVSWKPIENFNGEKVYTFLWANDNALFVGGYETIRSWNIKTKVQHVLFISAANEYSWNENGQNAVASAAGRVFMFNQTNGVWRLTEEKIQKKHSVQNGTARVYIDSSKNGYFENAIYVRRTSGNVQTSALFREPFSSVTGAYATKKPKVALVFDAVDSNDGVSDILSSLYRNNVKATFFINGEFIRRFPQSVREIVAGSHQCGSLFFTSMSVTNTDYTMSEDFIIQGLARNEDEFFNVTGKDLSLIWHTPQYITNPSIIQAAERAGYYFVKQDIAPSDWVTLENSSQIPFMYKPSVELVGWIMSKVKSGSVISISTGLSEGQRADYLYEYLDLLINALQTSGYDIVPYGQLYKK